ncbi:hypothetical protein P8452_58382 [Trifolium repens]|nr:hypothetical protein P8452_58382 [Trifolium repens]
MVYIFGVNFGTENNVQGALSSNSSLLFPQRQSMMTTNNNPNCWNTNIIGSRDDASSSLPNNHYGLEYLAEDFKKICLNEENVMRGSNLNIGVTMKRKKAVKSKQHQPSNFKTSLNINHTKK